MLGMTNYLSGQQKAYGDTTTCVLRVLSILVVAFLAVPGVLAAPSGLNVMPTADVLDRWTVSIEAESSGTGTPWGDGCESFALLQVGLGGGVEIGFDHCTSDPNQWLNVKWRVVDEAGEHPALAIGTQALDGTGRPQPFAVATKTLGGLRAHLGGVGIERKTRLMFGLDHSISDSLTLQADFISGDENTISYGASVLLTDSLWLTVARSVGNSAETGRGYIVNAALTLPIR